MAASRPLPWSQTSLASGSPRMTATGGASMLPFCSQPQRWAGQWAVRSPSQAWAICVAHADQPESDILLPVHPTLPALPSACRALLVSRGGVGVIRGPGVMDGDAGEGGQHAHHLHG